MNTGFIGCGKIAEPMIRYLARRFPDSIISVSNRTESVSEKLSREFKHVRAGDNQWVLDGSETVFLCLLADVARDALPRLKFDPSHRVISVMAGVPFDEVQAMISPARDLCITIPLPFMESGHCPLPVFPEPRILEPLFADENRIITVSRESDIGSHFAATAILSTLMAQLHRTSLWLGKNSGNTVDAETYVATLVSGYLNSIPKDGNQRFLQAIKDLSTEGGLNFQLLNHNRDAGILDTLEAGLEILGQRLKQVKQPDHQP
jgi:pyrroline-5-carboxylate reductase